MAFCSGYRISPEEKGNTPYRGERNESIDYTADNGSLTAEYPRNDVETEKTNASPVKSTDDGEDESEGPGQTTADQGTDEPATAGTSKKAAE